MLLLVQDLYRKYLESYIFCLLDLCRDFLDRRLLLVNLGCLIQAPFFLTFTKQFRERSVVVNDFHCQISEPLPPSFVLTQYNIRRTQNLTTATPWLDRTSAPQTFLRCYLHHRYDLNHQTFQTSDVSDLLQVLPNII